MKERFLSPLFVAAALFFILTPLSSAATLTWNAGSSTWNASEVWLDGVTPATWNSSTPDAAVFSGSGGPTITVDAATTASAIDLTNTGTGSSRVTIDSSGGSILTLNGALNKSGAGDVTANVNIGGTGSILVSAGLFTYGANSAGSTYSGGVTLSGGTLNVSIAMTGTAGAPTSGSLGTGVLSITGGTLHGNNNTILNNVTIGGNFTSNNSGTGTVNLSGAADLSGGIRTITTTKNLTLSGVVSNGGIVKEGSENLTLSGNNTYTGDTTINEGTLTLNRSGGTLANTAAVNVNGGTLALTQADTVGAVTLTSGTIRGNFGEKTLTASSYNVQSGTVESTMRLAGAGASLTKTTGGTVTLAGANTYTGATIINAGTLLVNGSLAAGSAVTLNAGTLGGSGTIGGLVTTAGVTSILSPGTSPGTLTLNGGLNASAGGTFVFELGTSSDLISLGGGIFTGSASAGGLQFDFSDSGGFAALTPYTLFTFGSSLGLDGTDFFVLNLPSTYVLDTSFGDNGFLINGTNLQVQFAAIPEPSPTILLGLGVVSVLGVRRLSGRSRCA